MGCGYELAWVSWNSGRSMRVSDSIPVLNQVRFVVVLGCGCSCPLCCVTITAVCVWGDMSSGCNAPRRFQPTTVWVQGAPTSRINQALELSVPIKQPCPSNRRAAGYRRSAHPRNSSLTSSSGTPRPSDCHAGPPPPPLRTVPAPT